MPHFGNNLSIFFISSGPNSSPDNETIAKYEIMDGAPVRGMVTSHLSFVILLYFYFCLTYLFERS